MEVNKTNLVDLTLLNTAYKINKKRIDLLSEKVKTKNLEVVDTATTNGTLTVNSGNFSADTLTVTGGMTINGGGAVLPNDKALILNGGGSVTNLTTFDSLTGSAKFGNAVDANGNVTGSAQIIVPDKKALSLNGGGSVTNSVTFGSLTGSVKFGNASKDGSVTGNAQIVVPDKKALSLNDGGSVTNSATFGSLTGSVKFGNAVDANGNVTGSAQIVVPTGKSLSLSGSAVTNGSTTIEGTITSSGITASGTAVLEGSTIKGATIQNGTIYLADDSNSYTLTVKGASNGTINDSKIDSSTIRNGIVEFNRKVLNINSSSDALGNNGTINKSTIESSTIRNGTVDLNSNKLTVTSASTITTITEGNNTTITGVGAIDAKSMTLRNTTTNTSSLVIDNIYDNVDENGTTDKTKVALYCKGGITGSRVYNAVWNDLADAIEVPFNTELEYGYCYKYKAGKVYKTDSYADSNVMGIHSDTAGMILGTKDEGVLCINLAVAGMVLAYVDKEYECGTALVATKGGKLTKANKRTRLFHPERIVATFYKTEKSDFWGSSTKKVAVNGRSWVKIK